MVVPYSSIFGHRCRPDKIVKWIALVFAVEKVKPFSFVHFCNIIDAGLKFAPNYPQILVSIRKLKVINIERVMVPVVIRALLTILFILMANRVTLKTQP